MKKEKKDKHFIKKPIYPGGKEAMRAFIKKEMRYPEEAMRNRIEGVVRVRYTVNYNGKIVNTKVIVHLGHGCDEEAERLVRLLRFSVPKNRNLKPLFHKTININFKLSEQPTYTVEYIRAEKKEDSGYSYTITI